MPKPPTEALRSLRDIPRITAEGIQRDVEEDTCLRQKIVRTLAQTNFGLSAVMLSGAQEAASRNLPPGEAYARGAYLIIGSLLANQETADLIESLFGESGGTTGDKPDIQIVPGEVLNSTPGEATLNTSPLID